MPGNKNPATFVRDRASSSMNNMQKIPSADSAGKPPMRRGVYGKRELRVVTLPPAWQVGDRKSFMTARAQSLWAILGDLKLSGRDKAVLAVCIHHVNPNEPGGDARLVACRMLRRHQNAKGSSGDFNRSLRYPKMGY
jgi:hypothetical protein